MRRKTEEKTRASRKKTNFNSTSKKKSEKIQEEFKDSGESDTE